MRHNFNSIIGDHDLAVSTLTDVLNYVEVNNPDAKLRIVILNNTIVALCATIEEILRALFTEYLTVLEANFEDFRLLRMDLQRANLNCAVQELKKMNKSEEDLKAATLVVTGLSICLNGRAGYRLLKESLVSNRGNFRSCQVTEISKNIGLPGLWRRVCDSPAIEDYTGEANLPTREMRLITKWNELFDERDLVVHRVSQASGWATNRIKESITLCSMVLRRVAECLIEDASELVNPKK